MRQSAPGEKETAGGRKGEGNRMPTYREFREQVRRRKRKRAMRRALIFVVVVAAVLAAAYGAICLLGEPSWLKGGDQTQSTPQSTSMTQSTPQGESTPESGSEAQSAAQSQQPASPAAEGTAAAWDTMQPLEKTLDQTVNSPDFRLLGLPENGQVDMKYFDRTAILGDSVSQGWNAYNTSDMKEHAFVCAYKNIGPSQVVNNEVADPGENSGRAPEAIFDTIINSNPKRLYILLGTNALVRNDDAAEQSYLAYYSQMLDKFREALGSEVDIYVQSVTPVRPGVKQPGLYRERIQRVNSELAKMAVEKGCYFINLHEVLADENGDLRADLAAQDGVHLNASAYPLVRDYLTTHTAYNPENPYLEGSPYYKAAE